MDCVCRERASGRGLGTMVSRDLYVPTHLPPPSLSLYLLHSIGLCEKSQGNFPNLVGPSIPLAVQRRLLLHANTRRRTE